ncbi:HAMP domain-containing sensor histidine kinase [Clostridium sp. D53t1_180928_C8]|uniref:HAMP domain-containing sensor histidine kinase n=1 Tax=Clostridium sp. D53t1_180928_C8 TaxID=2787101 RepID=UPI0018A983D8|nr:HAMP domain-containing sensor histidine kinase [Clostridium sp. D53t1_180928_C8]
MKRRKFKAGVAKELFKNYFIGYISLILIMIIMLTITFSLYITYLFLPASIKYEFINYRLTNNYESITEKELEDINGFLIVIDENNNLVFNRGNLIKEFEEITLDDYIKIFNFDLYSGTETSSSIKVLESMLTMINLENTLIKSDDGIEYSISYRFIKDKNKLIIFGVPYENINKHNNYNPLTGNKNQVIALLILNIIVLLLILYFFANWTARKFIKPINILNTGMKEIARGNYGEQVLLKKDNEFKELADGFNLMSKAIKVEKEENERLQQERNKLILHISHDLKNPLSAVLGYSDILTNDDHLTDDERKEYLSIINRNSKRATKIITDLFEFSLLDSMDYKLNTKTLDINEVLREIVAYYIPELETKEFNYDFDISEEEILINIDEVKFTRAISNLIDNSIKYNDKNTTLFVISRRCSNGIEIIISDNGRGIKKEVRDKIFDAFVREDKARSSSTGGTGLGLAITKAIIEKHNGTIELVNSIKGTEYKIVLRI